MAATPEQDFFSSAPSPQPAPPPPPLHSSHPRLGAAARSRHGAGTDPCSPSRFSSVLFSIGAARRRVSGAVRGIPRKGLLGPANIELLPVWGSPGRLMTGGWEGVSVIGGGGWPLSGLGWWRRRPWNALAKRNRGHAVSCH
jgi:hypothetical protein